MRAEDFKSAMRSYRWLERSINSTALRIFEKEHELTGLARRSTPMTKEQQKSGLPMPHFRGTAASPVAKIQELDELRSKHKALCQLKESLDTVLGQMPREDRDLILAYYADKERSDLLAQAFHYCNRKAVHRRMDQAIQHAILKNDTACHF